MIIWINKPRPFEAAVIFRFLYYSTGLENTNVYLTGIKKLDSFVRYSRVPVKVIKEKIRFERPEGNFLIIHPEGKSLEDYDLKKYSGFVIDFSNSINGDKVKGLGLDMLQYEAISVFSKIFIKNNEKIDIENNNKIEKGTIYFAKKILDGFQFLDNYYFLSPRLIYFCLKNFEKKFKILVDMEECEIILKHDKLVENIYISFYDNKMNLIAKDVIKLEDKILRIPLIIGKTKKTIKLYIDFDKRKIYLNKNFSISKKDANELLKDLINFFNNF